MSTEVGVVQVLLHRSPAPPFRRGLRTARVGRMQRDQALPLLTEAEERRLARQLEAGVLAGHLLSSGERPLPATDAELGELVQAGREAWDRLLLSNLRLVQKLAGQEARQSGLPLDDLFQEGCLALTGALLRFDADRGRFPMYAAGRIGRHLSAVSAARLGALGLPVAQAITLRRLRGLQAERAQDGRERLAAAEAATVMGRDPIQIERLLRHQSPVSLHFADAVPAPTTEAADPDRRILDDQLRREIARLSPELATVVRLRFGIDRGEPMDLSELATRLGVSLSTARRREREALTILRRRLQSCGITVAALAG